MVTYLSDDWVAALDRALARSGPDARDPGPGAGRPGSAAPSAGGGSGEQVTVQYRVSGGPAGERAWYLELGPSGPRARAGSTPRPCVTFTQTWDVAVAVARGEREAQQAVLAGEIRVSGDPTRLLGWSAALQRARERVAELARCAHFPDDPPPAGSGRAPSGRQVHRPDAGPATQPSPADRGASVAEPTGGPADRAAAQRTSRPES